jgi:hypothetical protein
MDIIGLLVLIIILGLVFYFVESQVPMSPPFKVGVRILAVIIVLVLLLNFLGINIPRLNIR